MLGQAHGETLRVHLKWFRRWCCRVHVAMQLKVRLLPNQSSFSSWSPLRMSRIFWSAFSRRVLTLTKRSSRHSLVLHELLRGIMPLDDERPPEASGTESRRLVGKTGATMQAFALIPASPIACGQRIVCTPDCPNRSFRRPLEPRMLSGCGTVLPPQGNPGNLPCN